MSDIPLYIGALMIAYLVPGADMILLLRTGGVEGSNRALATAAGLGAARALHVTLAALGLASLLTTSPWLFDLVRFAGTLYLLYLGLKIALSARTSPVLEAGGKQRPRRDYWQAFRTGFITNATNPKSLLFCSVLLPQFIVARTQVAGQFLILGVILVVIGALFDVFYCYGGTKIGRWIKLHPRLYTLQQSLFATALVALAIRLAATKRPA